jgi:starch phosphorylase
MHKLPKEFQHPYEINPKYKKSVAYFSMEFAIDQSLKIYSGGLGFLAGSHMRSAYDLKQNMIGIGILWKKGYYDQVKGEHGMMGVQFQTKNYHFLQETNIKFQITIHQHSVWVKALFLHPDTFGTAPVFLLSTDCPENDYLAQSTTFRLYDADPSAKIAQTMVLGIGGAKLLDELGYEPDIYHLNEGHGLSAAFHLFHKYKSLEKLKSKLIFTTHTPEEAGNEKHPFVQLDNMSFFGEVPVEKVREITGEYGEVFNHSLAALRLSKKANGVSKLHGEVSRDMWKEYEDICEIDHVTNSQNKKYWADKWLFDAFERKDFPAFKARKARLKQKLFDVVADQAGKLFDPNVLTIVWARRFASYKRADLITHDAHRLDKILNDTERPVQIIFAGKPYPFDYGAIGVFNSLIELSKRQKNVAVLFGYELKLSRQLKEGSDVWLNNPRVTREASGTSGMTAAMNGSINFSTNDGWIREFEDHGKSCFVLPIVDHTLPLHEQDARDLSNLYEILENQVITKYYDHPESWNDMIFKSMTNILPFFDSDRMADEYYSKMYQ